MARCGKDVAFQVEEDVSISGDVGPDAQTRCEKMGAVGTVVWFTVYAQTDSSASGLFV